VTLHTLNSSDFAQIPDCFLQPYNHFPLYTDASFELPSVLVPPDVIELDTLSTDSGEDALVKKEEWPEYYIRLFENDVRDLLLRGFLDLDMFPGNSRSNHTSWIRSAHRLA
jgi:hypothetical protein